VISPTQVTDFRQAGPTAVSAMTASIAGSRSHPRIWRRQTRDSNRD
jgi:hypothetical protein